jgi:hypothetical protein
LSLIVERNTVASRPAEDPSRARAALPTLRMSFALDAFCMVALVAAPLWVFGSKSGRLGIYADDPSFFVALPDLSPTTLITAIKSYVTGRNLHIFIALQNCRFMRSANAAAV